MRESVQNRQQPRLEILYEIAKILDVEGKDFIIEVNFTSESGGSA